MLGGFDFTFAYLDDIVIRSKTKELHREHINKVFAQIREFGFKVKEASIQQWTPSKRTRKTQRDGHKELGSKYEVYVRSPAPSHMQTLNNPFEPLQ